MPDIPKVSFIICTYNRAEYLKDSLETLIQSASGRPAEIVVIDNNSTDRTHQVCDDCAGTSTQEGIRMHYIKETKQGLSYARNRGIEVANAPILVFLDDDINVPSSFTDSWLSFFNDHPNACAAGGKIHVQFDDPRPEWMSSYLLPLLGHHDFGNTIKPYRKTDYPFGGNMALKADVFDDYGTFNTDLGRIGGDLKASEEKELFQRLQQDELTILYVPNALLYHRVNSSRLTKDYIRRQANGLGYSLAIQLKDRTYSERFKPIVKEGAKWFASVILFLFYTVTFRFSKGWMLLRFRKWIADGFSSFRTNQKA
jgi:glycosyltransferase involved in cell wall biosynthesis